MHVVLLEFSTYLSPKLPSGLLPTRPQWSYPSLCIVARRTYSKILSLFYNSPSLELTKVRFVAAFICSQIPLSRSIGWFSTTKISQDKLNFLEGDWKDFSPCVFFWRRDIPTKPRIVEINGGLDICENFETSFENTILVFLSISQKKHTRFSTVQKDAGASFLFFVPEKHSKL